MLGRVRRPSLASASGGTSGEDGHAEAASCEARQQVWSGGHEGDAGLKARLCTGVFQYAAQAGAAREADQGTACERGQRECGAAGGGRVRRGAGR